MISRWWRWPTLRMKGAIEGLLAAANGTRTGITLGEVIGSGKEGDVYRLAANQPCARRYTGILAADVREHIECSCASTPHDWYREGRTAPRGRLAGRRLRGRGGSAIGFFMNTLSDRYFAARDAFSTARRHALPA